jgi:hypothetical protein
MRKQQDAIKTEQENKVQRVKSLEQISAILDELEISDISTLDEEKKKALYAKLFSEDRSEEIEDEIVAKGKEKDASDEVGDLKTHADEVEEDKAEEIEADIKDLGEPKEEDPKDGEELESELDEANVTLDAMEPTEKGLVDFCKKKGIKWKVINQNGPAGGWPEVEYVGKKKDLEQMIKNFWEEDGEDSGLAEFINEARSINKIQNDWSKITAEMAKHAAEWKAASAEDKPSHLEVLKGLTAKKKALEAELDDAVTGKDKDLELVVTEGNAFTGALFAARNKGEKTFEFNGKTYKVHSAKVNEEDKEITEGNAFGDAVRKAKEAGEKEFEFDGKTYKVEEGNAFGDAVRKAKEAGEKEFEFDGKTYKVEEANVNEGKRENGKVVTAWKKTGLTDLPTIAKIYAEAMVDANFHREMSTSKAIGAASKASKTNVDATSISSAASWDGYAIANGTVQYLNEIGEEAAASKLLKAITKFDLNESTELPASFELVTEGSHGMATKLLQSLVKGDTSRAEGIKMSKELAQHYIDWIRTSPFGKKNGNLPLDMLIKASFNWGIERGLDSSLKSELADLKDSVKEALVFEGAVKQFEIDYKDMETNIKRGIGWIDPEYVEDTWERSSDAIDFEFVEGEIYNRLLKAGLLWYPDEDGEEKGKQVKSLKELGIKESLIITESKEAEEAESILNDLLDERGGDMEELHGMSMEDALDTVETYGHSGSKAKKIAQELCAMCNESVVTEAKSFSQSELESMAQVIADATAKVDKTKAKVVNFEMLDTPGRIAGFYIHKETNKEGAPSRYWITDSGEVVMAFRYDTFGPKKGTIAEVGDKLADVVKTFKANESVVTEGKDDFMARYKDTNINLKKGYKHLNDEELNQLYLEIGEFIADNKLKVKDATLAFESKVNEAEIKSDDEFKEYAMTVLKKAFGADFDEAKAEEVADGILKKCDGDYGACVGMLTSSLGESVTN